jgi:predicted acylesterase/phospholipase RssA
MWLAEPWLDKLRSQAAWAASLRGRAAENGTAGSQTRVVLRMLGELVRNPPEADGTLDALRQAMRAKSLLRMDPIRSIIESRLHPERILASGIALRVGAVSLETGDLRYFTETGEVCSREGAPLDVAAVPLREAVLASASIPVIFPPTELNGEHFVDGGVREILPLELAFSRLGAGHIFAVVASALGVEQVDDYGDRGLLDIARRVASDIGPDETLRKEMTPPRGWGRKVTVIAPEFDVHDALTIDPGLIATAIDYGYMRAADVLLGLNDEHAALSAEIARTRMRIRAAEGPVAGFAEPQVDPLSPEEAGTILVQETARLHDLIEARRSVGAPLPPGDCEPVSGPLAAADPAEPRSPDRAPS